MKAVEYYNKYYPRMVAEIQSPVVVISALFDEFFYDFHEMRKKRKIGTYAGIDSLIKEFDQKWKCMVRLFEKSGCFYINPDGFTNAISLLYKIKEV